MELDVALVTCRELPEPDPDAAPLSRALQEAGVGAQLVAWDDPAVDWSHAKLTVPRSTWNYPLHRQAFLRWAERVDQVSSLWNPLAVVRWNSHKEYLTELEQQGIAVVPTAVVRKGSQVTLRSIMEARGWQETVVKPAVSAASLNTLRVRPDDGDAGEAHLRSLAAQRDALVQQYLPSVESYGERSLVWIDGELTHAVRKSPRFSGEGEFVSPTSVAFAPEEATLAHQALKAAPGPLLYARIDLAPGLDGLPALMELELIEPSLFFLQHPPALKKFVAALRNRLHGAI